MLILICKKINAQKKLNLDIIQYKQQSQTNKHKSHRNKSRGTESPSPFIFILTTDVTKSQHIYQIAILLLSCHLNINICEI